MAFTAPLARRQALSGTALVARRRRLFAGPLLAAALSCPGIADAQSLQYEGIGINQLDQGNVVVSDVQGDGMGDQNRMANVLGESALAPVQVEKVMDYPKLLDTVQDLTSDTVEGDYTNGYHLGETTMDRAARYHGAAVSGDDLTSADYRFEDYNSDRGKHALVAQRLGVFDRNHTDPRHLVIHPYIEASQVLDSYWAPTQNQVTYTTAVVGAEMTVNGRNNQGVLSARYEQQYGWGTTNNSHGLAGIANFSTAIFPNELRMDYGGYANRAYVSRNGATFANTPATYGNQAQILAGYFGPTVSAHMGDIGISGHYRLGWTDFGVNGKDTNFQPLPGISVFNHSFNQDARLAMGVRPEQVLPIGVSVIGGYATEDASQLSQQLASMYARGEVIIPITDDIAAVGGAGYEYIKVSSLDAKRDSHNNPILDQNGNYITDYSAPRQVALLVEDTIWDAGMEWRPSRRTNLEIHVGHRYGDLGGYGSFTYLPTPRSSINVVVYDNIGGFGSDLGNTLSNMSSQFQSMRDAITGNISSCLATVHMGSCLGGVLGSANSAFARSNGVTAGYGIGFGGIETGFGFGWDRHRYIAGSNTVLANINGKADTYLWVDTYLGIRFNEKSQFQSTLNLYKYHSGLVANSDVTSFRLVSVYQYFASKHITMNASLAVNGALTQSQADSWSSSASAGVRYTF